jgi:hypothetical protein
MSQRAKDLACQCHVGRSRDRAGHAPGSFFDFDIFSAGPTSSASPVAKLRRPRTWAFWEPPSNCTLAGRAASRVHLYAPRGCRRDRRAPIDLIYINDHDSSSRFGRRSRLSAATKRLGAGRGTGVLASSASYLETIAPLSDDPLISLPPVAR